MSFNQKSSNRNPVLWVLFSALIWSICPIAVYIGNKALTCFDPYYHIKFAEIMRDKSLVIHDFPWATCSIWSDKFYDKDWLFHIFLVPFTYLGNANGVFAANVLTVFVIALAWGGLLYTAGMRRYIFLSMMFMLFCSGTIFPGRLVLCRSYLFSLFFLAAGIICVIREKRILLVILTILYSLSYSGCWQLLPVAFLFDMTKIFKNKEKIDFLKLTSFYVFIGLVIGILVNPYFPNNITGAFIQTVLVLKVKWFGVGGDKISQASELQPIDFGRIRTGFSLFLVAYGWTLFDFFKRKMFRKTDWVLNSLMFLSFIYLPATLMSMRFSEYLVPISASFMCLYWEKHSDFFSRPRRIIILFLILFIAGTASVYRLRTFFHRDEIPYASSAEWFNKNLERGEIIFHGDWDDSPMLFYSAPDFRYLVFLEPYFMYIHSMEKYLLWKKITDGKVMDTALMIYTEFGSNTVFVPPDRPRLQKKLLQDPHAKLVHFGPDGECVFTLKFTDGEIEEYRKDLPEGSL